MMYIPAMPSARPHTPQMMGIHLLSTPDALTPCPTSRQMTVIAATPVMPKEEMSIPYASVRVSPFTGKVLPAMMAYASMLTEPSGLTSFTAWGSLPSMTRTFSREPVPVSSRPSRRPRQRKALWWPEDRQT